MTAPIVYDYLCYREFLSDWFKWKKQTAPRFSHRGFVRRVGQKSPSLVVDLISGRRGLTTEMLVPFAKAMSLLADERRYLGLLVDLEREKEPLKKNAIWDRIAARRRFERARSVEGESFSYLSDWAYPAIRELAQRSDFRAEPEWIAATLSPKISTSHAKVALKALFELGMLVKDESGKVVQAEGAVVTPTEVQGLAVHNYHRGMIDRAREGIVNFKAVERHYTGVTACIPEAIIPAIKDEINAFAERLLELCDGAEGASERVYQFHLLAFPLSDGMGDVP